MGMAAGQARLLSITSRMSDNELRAQIINNNKMRLATESSQASEAYVAALNEAQLMFTNYDANDNATYQNLTFNALTSFNPYNNQYALINSSGNVLISEIDAQNYRESGGNLNVFLSKYGLEHTTTYFDNLRQNMEEDPAGVGIGYFVPYSTGEVDNNGNLIIDYVGDTPGHKTSPEGVAAALQTMYEGKTGTRYKGYDASLASTVYFDYMRYQTILQDKYDAYLDLKSSPSGVGNTYNDYKSAALEFSKFLFGRDIGEGNYSNLLNDGWIFSQNPKTEMYSVQDVILLDHIMDTYGEPKYTWIDKTAPNDSYNVNGEAKAAWYENLFNRIKSGGYQVLQDGLASSQEWIQFAFESGIATMEQVDTLGNWQPLIYSNCSDITSQTNEKMVAKAEAEYNAAMNKIENKDKRYDLELKNIDTEHNSLMTEYESIKTAIDKNVERTFKLYS